jgi:6,7-dimethyl-8-ribityllumazine synthase
MPMSDVLEGAPDAAHARFAVVVSRYNDTVTTKLLAGAVDALRAAGVPDDAIDVVWVPGAFEIPLVADRLAGSQRYAAVLCLGAVIKGETTHDQHINRAVSAAIMDIGLARGVPTLFGVLTCDNLEQALQRAGGAAGNKGVECAEAALRMVNLLKRLPS